MFPFVLRNPPPTRCHRFSSVGKVGFDRAHNHSNGLFCFPAHTVRACSATIQTHCVQALAWPLPESRWLGTARRELLSTRATIISVDGIGAFDHVSRAAMFEALRRDSRLATLIPFVRQFYGQDSSYLFYDASGHAHEVLQAPGGRRGTRRPLDARVVSGRHPPSTSCYSGRTPRRRAPLCAFLDDAYTRSSAMPTSI